MIPILYNGRPGDTDRIEQLRANLSLRPLLLENLDEVGPSHGETVRAIIEDVRHNGDTAVLEYTEKFDGVVLPRGAMRVPDQQIEEALAGAAPAFLAAVDMAIANIRAYQKAMLPPAPAPIHPPGMGEAGAAFLAVRYTPLERVGIYVPGGAAAYPSSVLMTAIPAQVAGVKEICLCSPMREGKVSAAVLLAAAKIGVREIYSIGGAQAIAAMALGTATVRPVDKIVGPGNTYVQLAKKELYGIVDIDSFAGPSEVVVLADDTAHAAHVAAEMLAQAEHAPGSCLLITAEERLAQAVVSEMEKQIVNLPRQAITRKALQFASAAIVAENHDAAVGLVNSFAPEHVQITTRHADADAERIVHAGAIFIGPFTPVAAGDYLAGPSHVLPTSGTARFFSGLSAESFRKRTSLVKFDAPALHCAAASIATFAETEGFDAHANSVRIRQ